VQSSGSRHQRPHPPLPSPLPPRTNPQASVKIPPGAASPDWLPTSTEQKPTDPYWAFQQLCQIARKYALYLSVGIVEASNVGSTLWCTNLLFGPSGALLSKHRKIQPTAAERIVWSQGEATNPTGLKRSRDEEERKERGERRGTDNLPVVSTPVGKIGGLICWESEWMLRGRGVKLMRHRSHAARAIPALQEGRRDVSCSVGGGADGRYLAPTADGRATWLPAMQHIAQEGRCFVITGKCRGMWTQNSCEAGWGSVRRATTAVWEGRR
jgi:hypothetical protein